MSSNSRVGEMVDVHGMPLVAGKLPCNVTIPVRGEMVALAAML